LKHGKGTDIFANGDKYIGDYVKGIFVDKKLRKA
jgi:hypothetical protein